MSAYSPSLADEIRNGPHKRSCGDLYEELVDGLGLPVTLVAEMRGVTVSAVSHGIKRHKARALKEPTKDA